MTTFILIRHANVTIDTSQPSALWQMSPSSQADCERLAKQIKIYDVMHVYTSTEPKAIQTGAVIANYLDIAHSATDNLQETVRTSTHFYDSQDDFRQAVHGAMNNPNELVFGDETFNHAKDRLQAQLAILAQKHPDETIGIVSHGRVLAMFLGDVMNADPIAIWDNLGLPFYAVLEWETQYISRFMYDLNDVLIRPTHEDDVTQLQSVAEQALKQQYEGSALASDTMPQRLIDKVFTAEAFQQALNSEHRHILVAEQDEQMVGFIQYGIPLMDDCDCEDLREIHALFLLPDTDEDIATELVYMLEDTINQDATVQRLSVFVHPEFMNLIKFYARLGFHHQQAEDVDGLWYMEFNL